MYVLSSVARDLMLINFLSLVHRVAVGSAPQRFPIHCLSDKDCQIVPSLSLPCAVAWCPQGRRFARRNRQFPHVCLNGMATQPTTVKVLVDWEYAPVPATAVARAKFGTRPINIMSYAMARADINDGPVGDPGTNLRLLDFLKEQIQRTSQFMIDTNIYENPGGGRVASIAPATSVHSQHADSGMT